MTPSPAVDVAVLDQLRSLGGQSLVARLVSLFLQSSRDYLGTIEAGFEGGDLEAVETAAHTLKSGAGSLGAREVQRLAEALETSARAGALELSRELHRQLAAAHALAAAELERELE